MSKLRQAAEQGLEALSLAFEKDLTYLSDNAMIARQDVVRGRLAVNALRAALAEREPQLKQRDGGRTLCGHCAATGEPIKRAHGIK